MSSSRKAYDLRPSSPRLVLEKALLHDPEYLKALEKTLAPEWSSKADTEAYRDL